MPYITQTIDVDLIRKILPALHDLGGRYFAIWFYPDISSAVLDNILKSFKPYFVTKKFLAPITVYKDILPKPKTNLYILNNKTIYELGNRFSQLRKYADGLSVYNVTCDLVAYTIFLEDIFIIKDLPNVKKILEKYTMEFSDIAPEGWEGK